MNKIIYYHYFCTDKSFDILSRTLDEIIKSDLYENINKLHINIVGENAQEHRHNIQQTFASELSKINLHQYLNQELRDHINSFTPIEIENNHRCLIGKTGLELDTLKLMYDQIYKFKNLVNVLYLHSKGSVNLGPHFEHNSREEWRLQMSEYVIRNWRKCQKDLNIKAHTGANFCHNHYSGNFWWATSDYIKSLPCPIKYTKLNKYSHCKLKQSPFYSAEFWLCSNL